MLPLFGMTDYEVIGDLYEVIPGLIGKIKTYHSF